MSFEALQQNIESPDLMVIPESASDILNFYSGSVLVTGATGFLGKLFLEKLLRVCQKLDKIYVTIRPKNNKSPHERLGEIFELPIFDFVRMKFKESLHKVVVIEADFSQENLGMTKIDRQTIIDNVNCIFHCAQNNRFVEDLKEDINVNIRATKDLIDIAQEIRDLKIFVYISTAFVSPMQNHIEEVRYNFKMTPEKLVTLIKVVPEDKLQKATFTIIGNYPNTNIFTKSIAEQLFEPEKLRFPVAIIRPSLIGATIKEPLAGWYENSYENIESINDCLLAAGLGYVRVLQLNSDATTELVPADYFINCAIVAACKTYLNSTNHQNNAAAPVENLIKIYNFVSSPETKIPMGTLFNIGKKQVEAIPSILAQWVFFVIFTPQTWLYIILRYFLHTVPAILSDWKAIVLGQEPQMRKRYNNIDKSLGVFSYYASKNWKFSNHNVKNLWNSMTSWERSIFEFNMANFDWEYYMNNLVKAYRVYVLKDPLDTIDDAKTRYRNLKVAHNVLIIVGIVLIYDILSRIIKFFFF